MVLTSFWKGGETLPSLVSCDCPIIRGACRFPLVGHRWLGWLIWSGTALVCMCSGRGGWNSSQETLERRAVSHMVVILTAVPCLLVLLFCPVISSLVFIMHGTPWLVAVFVLALSCLWGIPQFSVKTSPCRGRGKKGGVYMFTCLILHSWWSSAWLL